MTRTLPWLKGQQTEARVEENIQRPAKKQKVEIGVHVAPRRKAASPRVRTSSTSPPPQPPEEEFMFEGLEDDDKYVMVEDEFHVAAKTFTQHLHHAEYVRLKQLAKSRNTSKIHTISRPVDSRAEMKEDTRRTKTPETKSKLQKNTLQDVVVAKGAGESDLDDPADTHEGPWAGTSLQGLMASPKRAERSLIAVSGIRSSTRAAAGFTKAANIATPIGRFTHPVKEEHTSELTQARSLSRDEATASDDDGDDDDDLDAPIYVKVEDSARRSANSGTSRRHPNRA